MTSAALTFTLGKCIIILAKTTTAIYLEEIFKVIDYMYFLETEMITDL